MLYSDYYRLISSIKPAVETFSTTRWDFPPFSSTIEKSSRDYEEFSSFPQGNIYRYMVYLRHHGFPSPLLDWTASPYIATFFAFREALKGVEKRSIYVFCESLTGLKISSNNVPRIRRVGPYVQGHPRHFLQQSDHTICGSFGKAWSFFRHDLVFAAGDSLVPFFTLDGNSGQDVLWKFNLPSTERIKILNVLNDYNLNAFSLFDSAESLMETMWLREMVLRKSQA